MITGFSTDYTPYNSYSYGAQHMQTIQQRPDTPLTSHTSHTPLTSHTSHPPLTSHTSHPPLTSHTSHTPLTSHTSHTSHTSYTSDPHVTDVYRDAVTTHRNKAASSDVTSGLYSNHGYQVSSGNGVADVYGHSPSHHGEYRWRSRSVSNTSADFHFGCLLEFCVLATYKAILGWVPSSDNVHSCCLTGKSGH